MRCGAKLGASGVGFFFLFVFFLIIVCDFFCFFARTILEKQDRRGEYKESHI